VYSAKLLAARCVARLGKLERARSLAEEANLLATRFNESFWIDELGTYALALDGDKQPCRVLSSNAGQVLFTGIAPRERAIKVADTLMRPSFFSGWGIRTIAKTESRYNPMSYHNGSIWPHDNALIALGLSRYDQSQSVERLFSGLFEAATYMEMRRLPELFCGFQRSRRRGPTLYPVACAPQAWASATPFTLLEASLGLEFDPFANEIRLRNPRLPAFLDWVVLRNVQLGASSVDIKVRRHVSQVSVELLQRRGHVQVSVMYG
jgi:glycogen debranching enzyme